MGKKSFKAKKYVASGGVICPYCKSYDITAGTAVFETDITQDVECGACGRRWRDIYKLVDVEKINGTEGV